MSTTVAGELAVAPLAHGPASWTLPIPLFSIPLGLAGLGGAWSAASELLDASRVPAQLAYVTAASLWATFTIVYVVGTARGHAASFQTDLRHPLLGPLTAYIPVIAILLTGHYWTGLGAAGPWLTYVAVLALAVNAAALVAHWLTASLDQDLAHPGICSPSPPGRSSPASDSSAPETGLQPSPHSVSAAISHWCFGAVITGRVLFGSPLPAPFKPVLSILVSPSATASLAWFAITDGRIDRLQVAIAGVTLFLLLVQAFLTPAYLALPFTAQHLVFTFPLAVLGNMAVRWSAGVGGDGWAAAAWVVLAVTTALILLIAVGTLRDATSWVKHRVVDPRPLSVEARTSQLTHHLRPGAGWEASG